VEKGCESVAFPLISSGAYGYPKAEAIRVAVDTIGAFLAESEAEPLVYLVVFGHGAFRLGSKLFANIQSFMDDNYVDSHTDRRRESKRWEQARYSLADEEFTIQSNALAGSAAPCAAPAAARKDAGLEDLVRQLDESFQQMLLRKIDEKGITDAQCYKKANVDRKLFSKIRGNPLYKPSKATALAFAVALELPLAETRELLQKAGFALSRSSLFDVIVEYFIRSGNYDVLQINEALFAYDQLTLGGRCS
jgi:hypothetical protein